MRWPEYTVLASMMRLSVWWRSGNRWCSDWRVDIGSSEMEDEHGCELSMSKRYASAPR